MAHVLHINIFDALDLPETSLGILYNEASRQRMLDALSYSAIFSDKDDLQKAIDKVHGPYTEGFYKSELAALKERLGAEQWKTSM
ncbi:MAG TPA: hypothetical protein EYP19_16415 [Desulfobacterales bacterium]|nr:hypothetical protein [Desulfobacterales bacterium]